MEKRKAFGFFERVLALALCACLMSGAQGAQMQRTLAEKVVRLHVVANSDAPEDQRVKLSVRDAVLALSQKLLAGAENASDAQEKLRAGLGAIEDAANAALEASGYGYTARAMLSQEEYPERAYEDFSLPAGEYCSLRVRLGQAQGKNWWCVVFPALCTSSDPSAAAADAGLTDAQIGWIRPDGKTVVRFRLAEFFRNLRRSIFG